MSNYSLITRSVSSTTNAAKRYLQTAPLATNDTSYVPYKMNNSSTTQTAPEPATSSQSNGWSRHSLPSRSFKDIVKKNKEKPATQQSAKPVEATQPAKSTEPMMSSETTLSSTPAAEPKKKRTRRALKPRKALIRLSPNAIVHLKGLLNQPTPQMIRIGVRNRGCSGLTYNLEYISEPNKFDEVVEQDGVKVVIDSKALFSIVGSEMDWIDDKLSSRFVFKNPNSKGTCGCGESFMV